MGKYDKFSNVNTKQMLKDYEDAGKKKGGKKDRKESDWLLVLRAGLYYDMRILPYIHSENGYPFIDGSFHFGIPGQAPFACVYTLSGETCQACLQWSNLNKAGVDKKDNKFGRDRKTYFPVLVLNVSNNPNVPEDKQLSEEDLTELKQALCGKVKFFGVSNTLREKIVEKYSIPGYNPLHDILKGHVLTFRKNAAKDESSYPTLDLVDADKRPCAVIEKDGKPDMEAIEALLDSMPNLFECDPPIVKHYTAEKIAEIIVAIVEKSPNQEKENGTEQKVGNQKKVQTTSEEELDSMFNTMKSKETQESDVPF